jgi:hypothetical protein
VCDFTPGGRFETDINRLCPLTDTGVIRAAQRNVHQGKNGINKTLRSAQGQPEYAFNHQNGGDGEIRIALVIPRDEGVADLIPGLNRLIIQPEVREPRLMRALL